MSTKNIVSKKEVGKAIQITFDASDGRRTYEYVGRSAAAIRRGTDPGDLAGGRLVKHDKKK